MPDPFLVSVVTPSLNQAKFLEETLASVALQDYRPIEHLVIDGASRDGTVELLRRWEAQDHGPNYSFRWWSEPDRGHADALNKGFARVRGQVVGWLNADDVYFDRQSVRCAVNALKNHPGVDVVFGDVALISETGGLWMIWCFPRFNYKRALRNYILPQPTVFLRRSVVEEHRLDRELKVAVDHAYWLEIGREHKFLHLHRVQAADRDHPRRQTHVNRSLWIATGRQLIRAFGDGYQPGFLATLYDQFVRLLMRLKGAAYLVALSSRLRSPDGLAFPMWVDAPGKVFRRQFTMRLGNRPALVRPVPHHQVIASNESRNCD